MTEIDGLKDARILVHVSSRREEVHHRSIVTGVLGMSGVHTTSSRSPVPSKSGGDK